MQCRDIEEGGGGGMLSHATKQLRAGTKCSGHGGKEGGSGCGWGGGRAGNQEDKGVELVDKNGLKSTSRGH